MKLPLKVEYACRVLAQLGKAQPGGQLMHIDELAKAEAVPKNYLVQILSELKSGGLISSRRGKQGGYALAKKSSEVTVYDIVKVVDSDLIEPHVDQDGESGPEVAKVWIQISEAFEEQIRSYTLEAFIAEENGEMWHI